MSCVNRSATLSHSGLRGFDSKHDEGCGTLAAMTDMLREGPWHYTYTARASGIDCQDNETRSNCNLESSYNTDAWEEILSINSIPYQAKKKNLVVGSIFLHVN